MPYDMRVLHIIWSMDPLTGGPCQGIRNSSPVLEALEVHREVVCFDDPHATYIGSDLFPVHALGKGKTSWHYSSKLMPWLRQNIHRFDVVVTNGLWVYHAMATRRIMAKLRAEAADHTEASRPVPKWFIMPHGMLDPYFQRAKNRRLKAIRNWFYWKLIEERVVREADGLLFTCETELLMARETFSPYRPLREINVGYGIEAPPAYTPAMRRAFAERCPDVAGKPFILFLGRIHYKKGVDLLLEAYLKLSKELIGTGRSLPTLVIAGPGIKTGFGRKLLQTYQQCTDAQASIHFPEMLTGDAKWGAFYSCEAFILPSHQENFGIAVAEAMACGKPVLISNQVNIWREIEAGRGGVVAPNTVEGVTVLLKAWLNLSSEEKESMGAKARETFTQHFAIEPAAKKFKEALKNV